ncbi:MAG: ankyrin repeat domain-containing protein, partial [Verrucomicrobiales bacterium]|nr:ankyrin repeat domain-containing protein [Verrucomicrobiales bacterium]
ETTITLEDPSHPAFKRGRIAFNTAKASTTKSFSCASCHPDGHTDQLLWVLKTPIVTGGNQIMPRSTMPIRGLRDTAPFHWDGIPGDPYGGSNSANVRGHVEPNADIDKPESTTRHLIDGGLASTMLRVGDETKNDEGKAGFLSAGERDDLAKFLLNVTYPPAQKRAYTNELSKRAQKGFELFHITGNEEGKPQRNVCGNCHRMPFWVSTNTPGSGMDAPTWRGAYDRFLILPQGRLNVIDLDFYERVAQRGIPEREIWRFSWRSKTEFDPVWDMILEGSTGFSGAFARQTTLNQSTASTEESNELLSALEASAREGGVVLQCDGVLIEQEKGYPVTLQFDGEAYAAIRGSDERFTRADLIARAGKGNFVGTFTGRHGEHADYEHPQPALWTRGPIHAQVGKQAFPVLFGETKTVKISGRHIRENARVIVDGHRVNAEVRHGENEEIEIDFASLPPAGMHFLQVQNPSGLFSNDFIFHVAASESDADKLRRAAGTNRHRRAIGTAISESNIAEVKRLIRDGGTLNGRHPDTGSTPLNDAAFHDELEIVKFLLDRGADVSFTTRDGTTSLHTAAFFGRTEIVKLLLQRGASIDTENGRGETPIDIVSGEWDDSLAGIYRYFNQAGNLKLDMEAIQKSRSEMARLLKEHKR